MYIYIYIYISGMSLQIPVFPVIPAISENGCSTYFYEIIGFLNFA